MLIFACYYFAILNLLKKKEEKNKEGELKKEDSNFITLVHEHFKDLKSELDEKNITHYNKYIDQILKAQDIKNIQLNFVKLIKRLKKKADFKLLSLFYTRDLLDTHFVFLSEICAYKPIQPTLEYGLILSYRLGIVQDNMNVEEENQYTRLGLIGLDSIELALMILAVNNQISTDAHPNYFPRIIWENHRINILNNVKSNIAIEELDKSFKQMSKALGLEHTNYNLRNLKNSYAKGVFLLFNIVTNVILCLLHPNLNPSKQELLLLIQTSLYLRTNMLVDSFASRHFKDLWPNNIMLTIINIALLKSYDTRYLIGYLGVVAIYAGTLYANFYAEYKAERISHLVKERELQTYINQKFDSILLSITPSSDIEMII